MRKLQLLLFVLIASITIVDASDFYYYDQQQFYTIDSIDSAQFRVFEQPINQGLKNGVYWLKINQNFNNDSIVKIKNSHISNVIAYRYGKVISAISSRGYLSYEVGSTGFPLLLKITAEKEAFIPIDKYSKNEFLQHEKIQSLLLGLFYGFALMIILVNLFYYFNFKDNSFLYYALFILSIGLGISQRDGLLTMLGVSDSLINLFEAPVHSWIGFVAAIFAIDYLQLKNNYPKFMYSLYIAVFASSVLNVIYMLTNKYGYFVLSDFFTYYIFIACWFVSLLLFKKYSYAAFFCVAYFLIILFVTAFFMTPAVGVSNFGVDMNILKIGGYFEMLIITYAVVLRMNVLQFENNRMHDEILQYTDEIKSLSKELSKNQKGEKNHFADFDLSSRENQILDLMTQNKSNKQIANQLFISVNTVKFHIKNIYQKLQIKNRKQIHLAIKTI